MVNAPPLSSQVKEGGSSILASTTIDSGFLILHSELGFLPSNAIFFLQFCNYIRPFALRAFFLREPSTLIRWAELRPKMKCWVRKDLGRVFGCGLCDWRHRTYSKNWKCIEIHWTGLIIWPFLTLFFLLSAPLAWSMKNKPSSRWPIRWGTTIPLTPCGHFDGVDI